MGRFRAASVVKQNYTDADDTMLTFNPGVVFGRMGSGPAFMILNRPRRICRPSVGLHV